MSAIATFTPLHMPQTQEYARATQPRNATAQQRPAAVAAVSGPGDVTQCLQWLAGDGRDSGIVQVAVQATGHGAARDLGGDTLLLDTSAMFSVQVDPERQVVHAGAGATVGAVNAAAWQHGLLMAGGTAPDVGITGYTAWGGVGWLTRPHGLASTHLLSVDVVDADGQVVHADEDSDSDLLWAYRGGGGAGVATRLELCLFPAENLCAGFLLWPADRAADVATAWADALPDLHPALSSTMSLLLHAPDTPTVPESLRGQPVMHLAAASVEGEHAVATLRAALRHLPAPAADTLGPCDATRLATIHLDPPVAIPAVGEGRWLASAPADVARAIVSVGSEPGSPLGEIELRHVACPASGVDGALTDCPGPILLHVTGSGPDPDARRATQTALDAVLAAAGPADTGRSAASFCDGQPDAPAALDPVSLEKVAAVRRRVDPAGLFSAGRTLG